MEGMDAQALLTRLATAEAIERWETSLPTLAVSRWARHRALESYEQGLYLRAQPARIQIYRQPRAGGRSGKTNGLAPVHSNAPDLSRRGFFCSPERR